MTTKQILKRNCDYGRVRAVKEFVEFLKDHYWDDFEWQKQILFKHFDACMEHFIFDPVQEGHEIAKALRKFVSKKEEEYSPNSHHVYVPTGEVATEQGTPLGEMYEVKSREKIVKELPKETEDLILSSQIFVLGKLRDDLLETLKSSMDEDTNIDNYKVRVGNILFVMNSTIERLSQQKERLSENTP